MQAAYVRAALVTCSLSVMLAAPGYAGSVGDELSRWETAKAAKVAQGWVEVSPQVLERRMGTQVEHLGYGTQGLAWIASELQQRLDFLLSKQRTNDSAELEGTIKAVREALLKVRRELLGTSRDDTASVVPDCSFGYGVNASAYPWSGSPGVAAWANSWFYNDCSFFGDTYAYACAQARQNGVLTFTCQVDGPTSGTNVSSYASASVGGTSDCYSESYGYAQSSSLGISYSMYSSNNQCPAPPPSVSISGTTYEYFTLANCRTRTWSASVSGGTSPYSYVWRRNGSVVGYGSSYTGSVCYHDDGLNVAVTVTDAANQTASADVYVTVDYDNCGYCGCFGVGEQLPVCP